MTRVRHGLSVAIAVVAVLAAGGACGDDPPADLSADGAEGRRIANTRGCAGCHGSNGQGGVGPSFVGLAGSTVELDDGSTVVADEAYLRESIVEPDAKRVAGYDQRMPQVDLDDDEVAKIVQYIVDLAGP